MKPRLQDMTPKLQVKYLAFAGKMAEAGIPFALTCVVRSHAEHDALYAQGREPIATVNAMRSTAGMLPIRIEENDYCVTWTKHSRHFPDEHGQAHAFDICIMKGDRKATWDLKWDADRDGVPDYLEAAMIGQACGLDPGAFWMGNKDYPHYQDKEGV